jgi:16S rRNA (adenine1518-N6/adenine1519-N6)-dimethyltransferase
MPLTPKETTNLLKKLGHRPKKKLGQNFLIDGNIVQKSLDMADLPPHLPIVEIGPGLGTLTKRLLEVGHPVHAIEIDRALFENLESSLAPFVKSKQLNLTRGDGVKEPIGSLPENVEDYAVVANLPYAISSPWLEALLATDRLPIRMVLMLQREAVDRMWADHGTKKFNALSIFLQLSFENLRSHPVSRQCFFPAPTIDSMLVRMDRLSKPWLFPQPDRALIRRIFTQRRKQIGSLAKQEEDANRRRIENWLAENELARTLRPEQIEPMTWKSLAHPGAN